MIIRIWLAFCNVLDLAEATFHKKIPEKNIQADAIQ